MGPLPPFKVVDSFLTRCCWRCMACRFAAAFARNHRWSPCAPRSTPLPPAPRSRGKRGQKHYTVFVAAITPEAQAAWEPQLNHEHSEWRWLPFEEACQRVDLHPVVSILLAQQPNGNRAAAAVRSSGSTQPA